MKQQFIYVKKICGKPNSAVYTMLLLLLSFGAQAQFTPLAWQSDQPVPWNRDVNQNRIDDLIDDAPMFDKIDIVVALRDCVDEGQLTEIFSQLNFDNIRVGKHLSYVYIEGVIPYDLSFFDFEQANIALVELAAGYTTTNNITMQTIRATSSTNYSPNTVEDAFPAIDGAGINIAIFDSGVDDGHESFTGKYVAGYDAIADTNTNPDDDVGHGTHVAGTALGTGGVVGTFRGVAPAAGLIDIKFIDASTFCSTPGVWDRVARGMEWIIDNEAIIDVVNMSFGQCDAGGIVLSNGLDVVSQLANHASSLGIVMVAAAGNDYTTGFRSPGAASNVITVGASETLGTANRGDDVMAEFSNVGPRADDGGFDNFDELKPEVSAPGATSFTPPSTCVGITSAQHNTTSGYTNTFFCGTSMASPQVAGVAALIMQQYPGINSASVKDLIIRTSEDVDPTSDSPLSPVWNADWGYGLLDAFAALDATPVSDVNFPSHPPSPLYLSPDLTTLTMPIVEGVPNTVIATINNDGPAAFGVQLQFGVYIYTNITDRVFYDIGTQVVDIPANTTLNVMQPWVPMGSPNDVEHACLEVEIGYGLDSDYANNKAARNIAIIQTASPAVVRMHIENPLDVAANIVIEVDPVDVPNGWEYGVEPNNFMMAPEDCGVVVEATFFPPPGTPPGTTAQININVNAVTFFGTTPIGGASAIAVQTLRGNLGDLNGDEQANSTDALVILSREVGGIQLPLEYPIACGDVNQDGKINSTDALIILSFDAGFNVPFPILELVCSGD